MRHEQEAINAGFETGKLCDRAGHDAMIAARADRCQWRVTLLSSAMRKQSAPPVALTIAGSDNSAGAGLQADLKTFGALGVYGLTAVTCVVAEAPGRVSAIGTVDPKIIAEQIRISLETFPVGAMKTGLLHSR